MEFTVQQFLQMESAAGSQLLTAQRSAAQRVIRSISVMEGPVEDFVRQDELVLTIAAELWGYPERFLAFTRQIRDAGAAALAISMKGQGQELPPCVFQFCLEQGFPLILVPWERRFSEIIEEAHRWIHHSQQEEMDAYEQLRRELFASYLSDGSFSDAAQILSRRGNRPFCITDGAWQVRGCCRELAGLAPGQTADEKAFPLCLHIRSQGRLYGYLLGGLPRDGRDRPLEKEYLERYAALPLSLWFDREQTITATRMRLKSDFVRRLAQGQVESPQELREQAALMGFCLELPYTCILGQAQPRDKQSPPVELEAAWEGILGRLLELGRAVHRALLATCQQDTLILYLESPAQEGLGELYQFLDQAQERLAQVLPQAGWHWGIGELHPQTGAFHQEFCNAQLALELCLRQPEAGRVAYQDTRIHRLLAAIAQDPQVRQMARELCARLRTGERTRRLELGATFLCYLEHGCNVSQTARALHLHRQSLIHRLHRLEEVTGLSLENYNDRFLLELCVRLGAGFSLEEA